MTLPVKLKDVVDALKEGGDELVHYMDKRTGEIFPITDEEMSAAEEDEPLEDYPQWQQESLLKAREILESDEFAQLPSQFDIHEHLIMERFAHEYKDRRIGEELLRSIKGQGAFRRFKDTLFDLNIQDAWYEFRRQTLEQIAIEWLEEETIPFTREDEVANASGATM